jgi:hypothetical protein
LLDVLLGAEVLQPAPEGAGCIHRRLLSAGGCTRAVHVLVQLVTAAEGTCVVS